MVKESAVSNRHPRIIFVIIFIAVLIGLSYGTFKVYSKGLDASAQANDGKTVGGEMGAASNDQVVKVDKVELRSFDQVDNDEETSFILGEQTMRPQEASKSTLVKEFFRNNWTKMLLVFAILCLMAAFVMFLVIVWFAYPQHLLST